MEQVNTTFSTLHEQHIRGNQRYLWTVTNFSKLVRMNIFFFNMNHDSFEFLRQKHRSAFHGNVRVLSRFFRKDFMNHIRGYSIHQINNHKTIFQSTYTHTHTQIEA